MKELINFIKWQWGKWEFWQKSFIFGSAFFGAGVTAEAPYSIYLFMIPSGIVIFWMTKWLVWDGTRTAWLSYKKEKANLFNTIKDGKQNG
jgi:hypothetical protein